MPSKHFTRKLINQSLVIRSVDWSRLTYCLVFSLKRLDTGGVFMGLLLWRIANELKHNINENNTVAINRISVELESLVTLNVVVATKPSVYRSCVIGNRVWERGLGRTGYCECCNESSASMKEGICWAAGQLSHSQEGLCFIELAV